MSEIDIVLQEIEELCSKLSEDSEHENHVKICDDLEKSLNKFVKIRANRKQLVISDKARISLP